MSSTRYGSERKHATHLAQTYLTFSAALLVAALAASIVVFAALVAVSQFGVGAALFDIATATDALVIATAILGLVDVVFAASTLFLFILSRLEH